LWIELLSQEKFAAKGGGENPEAAGAAARLCETGNHTPGGWELGRDRFCVGLVRFAERRQNQRQRQLRPPKKKKQAAATKAKAELRGYAATREHVAGRVGWAKLSFCEVAVAL
jgi:hypothetical protein